MGAWRRAALGILWALAAMRPSAAVIDRPSVVVYVDNRVGVPPQSLLRAQDELAQVFQDAGIDIEWSNGGLTESLIAARGPATRASVVVMLVGSNGNQIRGTSACLLGLALQEQSMAYVFYNAIAAHSRSRPVDADRMLGHVIAHELGHVLLPHIAHSRHGIMRATLDTAFTNPNRFTASEASAMRVLLGAGSRDR